MRLRKREQEIGREREIGKERGREGRERVSKLGQRKPPVLLSQRLIKM